MGNHLCRRAKDEHTLGIEPHDNHQQTKPRSFDKIFSRVNLCPSNLNRNGGDLRNQKQVNRYEITPSHEKNGSFIVPVHTKSKKAPLRASEWTDVSLVVPQSPSDKPKFADIFSTNTPVPPPRKHKKRSKEKIEAITKNGINAIYAKPLQSEKNEDQRVPVEEPLITRTVVKRHICDIDEHRPHHHHHSNHKKHHSTVSLPNYSELQLSVARNEEEKQTKPVPKAPTRNNSAISLPGENNKRLSAFTSGSKLETYMTRCRSFGSLLPHQLLDKLKTRHITSDVESDDSFGGLDDWDLGLIEHYKPQEATLPRPPKSNGFIDNETQLKKNVVNDVKQSVPVPPVRRAESIQRRLNKFYSDSSDELDQENNSKNNLDNSPEKPLNVSQSVSVTLTPPKVENSTSRDRGNIETYSRTPPPSPDLEDDKKSVQSPYEPSDDSNEHSSLMKIIKDMKEEINYERADKLLKDIINHNKNDDPTSSKCSSMTPSLHELEAALTDMLEEEMNSTVPEVYYDAKENFSRSVSVDSTAIKNLINAESLLVDPKLSNGEVIKNAGVEIDINSEKDKVKDVSIVAVKTKQNVTDNEKSDVSIVGVEIKAKERGLLNEDSKSTNKAMTITDLKTRTNLDLTKTTSPLDI